MGKVDNSGEQLVDLGENWVRVDANLSLRAPQGRFTETSKALLKGMKDEWKQLTFIKSVTQRSHCSEQSICRIQSVPEFSWRRFGFWFLICPKILKEFQGT